MAFKGSVVARVFIWESTSRSWDGGRVLRVREMASGQVRPGGRSMPVGRGGREEDCGGGMVMPFEGGGAWYVGCAGCYLLLLRDFEKR